MKKTTLLFATLFATFILQAQNLAIADGKSVTVKQGASININGLKLTPDTPFTINGANDVNRSSTAITSGGNSSINRVFSTTNIVNNFTGTVYFYYEDGELNGIDETILELQVKDGTGTWTSYEGTLDNSANIITTVFNTTIDFTDITAAPNDGTLSIEDLGFSTIRIYPNPATSHVTIDYNGKIEVAIYNALGQSLLKTQNKIIDMSAFNNGIYLFIIKDQLNGTTNSFKIIKQ
jgi:hypothetical protein